MKVLVLPYAGQFCFHSLKFTGKFSLRHKLLRHFVSQQQPRLGRAEHTHGHATWHKLAWCTVRVTSRNPTTTAIPYKAIQPETLWFEKKTQGFVQQFLFLCTTVSKAIPRPSWRSFRISLRWLIYIVNSVDKTKLSCNTPTDADHSFFRNLPPPEEGWFGQRRIEYLYTFKKTFYASTLCGFGLYILHFLFEAD